MIKCNVSKLSDATDVDKRIILDIKSVSKTRTVTIIVGCPGWYINNIAIYTVVHCDLEDVQGEIVIPSIKMIIYTIRHVMECGAKMNTDRISDGWRIHY